MLLSVRREKSDIVWLWGKLRINLLIVIYEDIGSNINRIFSNWSLILSLLSSFFFKCLIESSCFCLGSSSEMLKILLFVWLLGSVEKIDLYVFCIFLIIKKNGVEECIFLKGKILFLNKF